MKLFSLFRKSEPQPPKRTPLERIAALWNDTSLPLLALGRWQTVAYAYIICCRFQPIYEQFCLRYGQGSTETLSRVRALLATSLLDNSFSAPQLRELQDALYSIHPEGDEDVSANPDVVDALVVHSAALDMLALDHKQVLWLMDACFNVADRKAFDTLFPQGGVVTKEIEQQVRASEPMKREREWQHALIDALSRAAAPAETHTIATKFLHNGP